MANHIGHDIGRYHIVEQLGQGGMATVYKAFDTRLDREVAIKVIRMEAFGAAVAEDMLKRFEREGKSLAKMMHPNIVPIYDYGEHEGSPYLVMGYIPGGTLKSQTGRPMFYPEAARIVAPVARALAYAHSLNVIHRDVKPANILMTAAGEPMLSDFGVAKILESDEGNTLTGTGVGIGTPEYMAPEQWMNKVVPQTDIYALGVVFYELVTGHKPYTADTPAAVLIKQTNDPLPRPNQFIPNLPNQVEQVIFKALAKRPEDRYASMSDFAAALDKIAAQTDMIQPQRPTLAETTPSPVPAKNKFAQDKRDVTIDASQPTRLLRTSVKQGGVPAWVYLVGGVILLVLLVGGGWLAGRMTASAMGAGMALAPTGTNIPTAVVYPAATKGTGLALVLPTPAASGKIKIGLSFPDFATERWKNEDTLLHKLLEAKGYEVITSEANHDVKLQNDQIGIMVSQGVKGLIIIAENGDAAVTSVEKAATAGVKIIAYDRLIKTPKISAFLSFNNVAVGNGQADGILKALNIDGGKWTKDNPAKVVLLGGSPTDNNAILFRKGQVDVLQNYIDSGVVKVVADQWVDNWDADNATRLMENIITAQKGQIDAVVASNDGTALGALQALKAHKLMVPISGQDATADGCNSIMKGELTVTIFKDIRKLSPLAAEAMDNLLQGKPVDGLKNYTMVELTNKKDATGDLPCVFVPVVLVNKNNLYDQIVKSGFQSYDDVYRDIPSSQRPPRP